MSRKPQSRMADRQSRPHPDRFLTFMVVLTQRTFELTVPKKVVVWILGVTAVICAVAFIGSGYGFWATKKIIGFSHLEKETREQQQQLSESMEHADKLKIELDSLYGVVDGLIKELNPQAAPTASVSTSEASASEADDPYQQLSALKTELLQADDRLKTIQAQMNPIIHQWNHTPSVWPTTGAITSGFGTRIHPFSWMGTGGGDGGLPGHHSGLDISNALGTPIQATAHGKVTFTGWSGAYGLTVIIRHSSEFETLYAHLQRITVRVGQEVERGHIIGNMGQTGRATGPHLHYEVKRNGQAINPRPYLRLQRQRLTGLR